MVIFFNLGKALNFYKSYNKAHYREMEEEINLLQEIYFNTCFGPNQLKNNYLIDWELQSKEVEVQEYFFNIKDNFITMRHVFSTAKISAELPTEVECTLKEIETDFIALMASTQKPRQYDPGEPLMSENPDLMSSPFGGPSPDLDTPMVNANFHLLLPTEPSPEPEFDPNIGMNKKELAEMLLGRKRQKTFLKMKKKIIKITSMIIHPYNTPRATNF